MSFVRFGEQDSAVYVYDDVDGKGLCCCMCNITHGPSPCFNHAEMLVHLREHERKRHVVPDFCTDRIVYELMGGEED